MKRNHFIFVIVLFVSCASLILNSCKKDKKDASSNDVNASSYFGVQNGQLVNGSMPSASGSNAVIESVFGNNDILAGGSNTISINTSSTAQTVFVGIEGVNSYYAVPATSKKNSNLTYLVTILLTSNLPADQFVILLCIKTTDGSISTPSRLNVSRLEAGTGKLQVSLSWNQLNDVDLHLVEPALDEIFYANGSSDNGGLLDIDSNSGCSIDSINNENITYADTVIVANGEYIVRVDLFSACNITAKTNYTVTARYNGNLITPTSGTNPYNGSFMPEDADYGGFGSGLQVMKFNVSAAKKAFADNSFRFVYPARSYRNLSPTK